MKKRRIPLLEGTALPRRTLKNYVKLSMEYVNTSSTKLSLVFEVAVVAEQDAFVISKLFGVYLKTYPRRETERDVPLGLILPRDDSQVLRGSHVKANSLSR